MTCHHFHSYSTNQKSLFFCLRISHVWIANPAVCVQRVYCHFVSRFISFLRRKIAVCCVSDNSEIATSDLVMSAFLTQKSLFFSSFIVLKSPLLNHFISFHSLKKRLFSVPSFYTYYRRFIASVFFILLIKNLFFCF